MNGTAAKTECNTKLFDLWNQGVRPKLLVKRFHISRQRIHAIVRAQAELKRKVKREAKGQKEGAGA
jgi:Mor family transcriptional regulator